MFTRRQFLRAAALGAFCLAVPEWAKAAPARKVTILNLEPGVTVSAIGPGGALYNSCRSTGMQPVVFESVPVADESTGDYGGIWIDYHPNSASGWVSESSRGAYIPVYSTKDGSGLVIDFKGPGMGYYQMNLHSLEETLRREGRKPLQKVGIAVLDSGIDPYVPRIRQWIDQGIIRYEEGYNTAYPGELPSQMDAADDHGICITSVIIKNCPQDTGMLSVYPVGIYTFSDTVNSGWKRIQDGISWAARQGNISLANLSYVARPAIGDKDFESEAVAAHELRREANMKGTYIIGSAGNKNEFQNRVGDAVTDHVKNLRVGALNNGGRVFDFSVDCPDLVGPSFLPAVSGMPYDGTRYHETRFLSGTSAASPSVLSVAAWMLMYTQAPAGAVIDAINSKEGTTDIYGASSPLNLRDGLGIPDALKVYQILRASGY